MEILSIGAIRHVFRVGKTTPQGSSSQSPTRLLSLHKNQNAYKIELIGLCVGHAEKKSSVLERSQGLRPVFVRALRARFFVARRGSFYLRFHTEILFSV